MNAGRILIIDSDEAVHRVLDRGLRGAGWTVYAARSGSEGLRKMRELRPEVVLCERYLDDLDGPQVIDGVRQTDPTVPVLLMSADDDLDSVLSAVRRGAFDYILKADIGPLAGSLERALAAHREHCALRLRSDIEAARGALDAILTAHPEVDASVLSAALGRAAQKLV